MYKITETNNFDSIYWHDGIFMSIEFDVLKSSVLLYIDLNISNFENHVSYQPCVAIFGGIADFRMNLEWEQSEDAPSIAYIERELIEKPKHYENLDFYKYTVHFLEPANGKIDLPLITEFKLVMLSEPIIFEGEDNYFMKRTNVIKNYILSYKK